MTARQTARLTCRVLAIYALIQALTRLEHVAMMLRPLLDTRRFSNAEIAYSVAWALIPILLFATGAFLWRWSGLVAAWMVGHDIQDEPDEAEAEAGRMSAADLQVVAFSALGLWVLIGVVPTAIATLVDIVVGTRKTMTDGRGIAMLVDLVIRLALGVWLLFGAAGLVRLVRSVRNVGLD